MSIFDDNTWLTFPGNQVFQKEDIQAEEILDSLNQNTAPLWEFLSRYRCAVMEIETKFNGLNERFSTTKQYSSKAGPSPVGGGPASVEKADETKRDDVYACFYPFNTSWGNGYWSQMEPSRFRRVITR